MNYSFDSDHAVNYGVDEAIMLSNIIFWLRKNKVDGRNIHDGRVWTFNSIQAYSDLFPFWTFKQARRILDSLVDHGVLVVGNYNTLPTDRTRWFALTDESMLELPLEANDGSAQKGKALPDSKHTDSKHNVLDKSNTGMAGDKTFGTMVLYGTGLPSNTPAYKELGTLFFALAEHSGSPAKRLNRLHIETAICEMLKHKAHPKEDIRKAIAYLFSEENLSQGQYTVRVHRATQFNADKVTQLLMKVDELEEKQKRNIGSGRRI